IRILREELRVTVQRINLFEKVKIPETRENIRKIQIFLGDLQTAEVVRGKIAKAKLEKRREVS
ncbi:MAG TPA: V-type ATP synthase subunit D, partial [Candidatus Marinimicrobia bacterium]|nr:V-type ATP synthase subunit D [Candidatus Neomarinimicrobiota bacterium]